MAAPTSSAPAVEILSSMDDGPQPLAPVRRPATEPPAVDPSAAIPMPQNNLLTEEEALDLVKELVMQVHFFSRPTRSISGFIWVLFQGSVYKPTPSLYMCLTCKTGLMTARFMMRHVLTEQHREPMSIWSQQNQQRQMWRDDVSMNEVK